jgi:hypothetical protein
MRAAATTLVLLLAACGGGRTAGDSRARPPALVTVRFMDLPTGINGKSFGGLIGISRVFEGYEEQTLDALSVLMVHELWHEFVTLEHLPSGCYSSESLSVRWGDPLCAEEQIRWQAEVPSGEFPLVVEDQGLLVPTQQAAAFIAGATAGHVTFAVTGAATY